MTTGVLGPWLPIGTVKQLMGSVPHAGYMIITAAVVHGRCVGLINWNPKRPLIVNKFGISYYCAYFNLPNMVLETNTISSMVNHSQIVSLLLLVHYLILW